MGTHASEMIDYVKSGDEIYVQPFNSCPPGQNGRHFADNVFQMHFMKEKFCILIRISLNFVSKNPIDYKLALV